MDKKNSVMGNLHKLEYRPNLNNNSSETDNNTFSHDNLSDNEENFTSPSSLAGRQDVARQSIVEPPIVGRQNRTPVVNQIDAHTTKLLKDALIRRIEDYRLSRRDLISRITVAQAEMSRDINDMKRVLEELESVHSQLSSQLEKLGEMPDLQEKDASDQTLVGTESHRLEQMRLDIIRTIARAERSGNQHETVSNGADRQINLDSVTFGQILRYGFVLSLPLIIVMILTALIIGVAIVGAFNGSIRW